MRVKITPRPLLAGELGREKQEALLLQRGRAMLHVYQLLASTVQYLKRSLLFNSASDLPLRTIKLCSIVFGVTSSLSVINKIH